MTSIQIKLSISCVILSRHVIVCNKQLFHTGIGIEICVGEGKFVFGAYYLTHGCRASMPTSFALLTTSAKSNNDAELPFLQIDTLPTNYQTSYSRWREMKWSTPTKRYQAY